MTTREQIYQALFDLVIPLCSEDGFDTPFPEDETRIPVPTSDRPFAVVTREVIETARVAPGLQPILMMYEMDERFEHVGQQMTKLVWTVVFIIGATTQKGTPGQTVLNPLIDALISALGPDGDDPQTLGGLCDMVILNGSAGKDHGDNSTAEYRQASYYLPVQIINPYFGE